MIAHGELLELAPRRTQVMMAAPPRCRDDTHLCDHAARRGALLGCFALLPKPVGATLGGLLLRLFQLPLLPFLLACRLVP